MIIKKLFTDWKKAYGFFWIFIIIFISFVSSIELKHDGLDKIDIVGLILVVGISHFLFIGIQYGSDNDKKREIENHSITLNEFVKEYGVPEEKAVQHLKDGKLDGTISFKTYSLRDKSKEEIQNMN